MNFQHIKWYIFMNCINYLPLTYSSPLQVKGKLSKNVNSTINIILHKSLLYIGLKNWHFWSVILIEFPRKYFYVLSFEFGIRKKHYVIFKNLLATPERFSRHFKFRNKLLIETCVRCHSEEPTSRLTNLNFVK